MGKHQTSTKSPQNRGGYKGDRAPSGRGAPDRHHPNTSGTGLPPPQHIQQPRGSIVQQHQPESPHQNQQAGAYASPHPTHQTIPGHHQSPYVNPVQGHPGQHQPDLPYYQQPQYGANGSAGSYSSGGDIGMATTTMNRGHPYPTMYPPHQSSSPGQVQSPQHTDQHGRPLYQPQQMTQNMYPYPYAQMPQQSPYGQHPQQQQTQHGQLATNPMLMKYEQGQPMQSQAGHPHTSAMPQSPRSKITPNSNVQRTPVMTPSQQQQQQQQQPPQPQGTPSAAPQNNQMHAGQPGAQNVNPNAAPGPIPATTPLVVRQDGNGVQWIAFEYSRDRVKMEYTIRCDVESINVDDLPQEFKTENCVYPRACCPKDQYKGNRLHYETECNTVGWALAQLNPCLRGKRGLIQRAVDSWRNSNQDPRLRSRRVRRQAKIETRKGQNPRPSVPTAAPMGQVAPGVPPNAAALAAGAAPGARQPAGMGVSPQIHHHHEHPAPQGGPEDVNGTFRRM